jgi:serine/threonine protein kinase HipA of HipAB toxin-antitoxin module
MAHSSANLAIDRYNQMLTGIYRAHNQKLISTEQFNDILKLAKITTEADPKPDHYEAATQNTMSYIQSNLRAVADVIDQVKQEKAAAAIALR